MELRISKTIQDSIVDGPGLRYVIFTQGCHHDCFGCHNPGTHDPAGGYIITIDEILKEIDENPLLFGVTISGGEPILKSNIDPLVSLCRKIKERDLDIIMYTGFTWEELWYYRGHAVKTNAVVFRSREQFFDLFKNIDILVDGRYLHHCRTFKHPFIGSTNQRIIDVYLTMKHGGVINEKVLGPGTSWKQDYPKL